MLSARVHPLGFPLIDCCCYRNGMGETKIPSEEQWSTAMWSSILLGETGKPSKPLTHFFLCECCGGAPPAEPPPVADENNSTKM